MAARPRSGLLPDRRSSHFQTNRHNSGLLSGRFNSSSYDRASIQDSVTTGYNRSQTTQRNPAAVSNTMDSHSYRPRPAAAAIDPDDVQARLHNETGYIADVEARLRKLQNKTGYNIVRRQGQRIYGGPPPGWEGEMPGQGTEVYCYMIPRDCFEDELVPVFSNIGPIFELRLMLEFSGTNRTYCYIRYTEKKHAMEAIRSLDGYEIRRGHKLAVTKSEEKRRLWINGMPKSRTVDEFKKELGAITSGISNIVLHPSQTEANRTSLLVEYKSHRDAAQAKRKLTRGKGFIFGVEVRQVNWVEQEPEVNEQQMERIKILYVRHLNMTTTEKTLWTRFTQMSNGQVELVKKIKDFAYVHLTSRESAELVMNRCDQLYIDGQKVDVLWAKPPNKDYNAKKLNREATFTQPPPASQNWSPTHILDAVCQSNNWGKPVYKLNWARDTFTGLALYHYSVSIPQYPAPIHGNVFQSMEWMMSVTGAKTRAAQHILSLLKLRRPHPLSWDQSVKEVNAKGKDADWVNSLLRSMKDPSQIVYETKNIVIILDKYPKAREHYMVLPRDDIRDIYSLTPEHLPLLQTMEAAGLELTGNNSRDFMMGFHAQPHLNQLHLHVVSKDLYSSSLWKKHHWNIFTTPYFISCQTVLEELVKMGRVRQRTEREVKGWREGQLQCHICSHYEHSLLVMKAHIKTHFDEQKSTNHLPTKKVAASIVQNNVMWHLRNSI